ncbi:MAG: ABC transporter transmembrane domain-containing protein, partial [Dehalococcoidia bacterium]
MMGGMGGGHWTRSSRAGDIDEDGTKLYDSRVVLRLGAYLIPYKRDVFASLLGVVIYTLMTIAIPLLIAIGIGRARELDSSALNIVGIFFAAVLVVHFIANYSHQLLLATVSQKVIYNLRNDLFLHLQRLPMSFHNRNKVGSVMSRAQNDVYQLQEFLDILVVSVADLLSLIGIVTIMLVISWQLTLVSLATFPILAVIVYVWQRYARPTFLRVRIAISRVNGSLAENLTGVRVVQS